MDSNLRRIVSEATRLCREQGHKVDPNIVAYVASLQAANGALEVAAPGASLEQELDAASIAAIGAALLPLLLSRSDPWIATATMQVMMEVAYKQQREVLERELGERQERSGMLARAVTGPRALKGNSAEAYEKFYKLVMEYICVEAGLELALHDEAAGTEVRAAVESVFPISAVARYMTLQEGEKQTQVEELSRITTGICLYNRAIGRGGSALPGAAAQYLPQAGRLLADIGRRCAESAAQLRAINAQLAALPPRPPLPLPAAAAAPPPASSAEAAAAEGGDGADSGDAGADKGKEDTPPAAAEAPAPVPVPDAHAAARSRLQAEAMHRGQALQLFESLQGDLQEGLEATQQLDAELEHLLVQAQDCIGNSATVGKDVVYPVFDRLGAIHSALHQELRMLVVRQRLYDELAVLQEPVPPPPAPSSTSSASSASSSASAAASGSVSKAAAARSPGVASTSGGAGSSAHAPQEEQLDGASMASLEAVENEAVPGLAYIRPTSASQLQGGLALAGFCPVSLGAPRPGSSSHAAASLRRANPSLGYIAFRENEVYGFGSNAALQAFVADPDACLAALAEAVQREPLLVRLLGLPAPSPAQDIHAVVAAVSGPLKVDFGCQTPVHFLERHIDPSYEWNVWALRRRALALANLRAKATHGAQTADSHFRRDGDTQVWRPKEATVQTRVNKGQAMPKKLQYVAGLRGAPDTKMKVVRLQLDLGQPHQH